MEVLPARRLDVAGPVVSHIDDLVVEPDVHGVYARWGKRVLDVLVASVLLVLVAPLLLVLACVVRAALGPGIIFRQERVGLGGRPFTVYKFRTMLRGVAQRHKDPDDPRHTRIGRLLRRTSLDELPQLVNVLRGDMSLVGPRPELTQIVAGYEPWQHARHLVRPGLTGYWQTRARRLGPMHHHTLMDIQYLHDLSAWTDVRLLAATVPAVLWRQRGT
jgi:lipopolysaccharide/colanic/teichoic acid biosynthesis glycosyltransferase